MISEPVRSRHGDAHAVERLLGSALIAIRRPDSVLVCFEGSLDSAALREGVEALEQGVPGLAGELAERERQVHLRACGGGGDALAGAVEMLRERMPVLDMS